MIFLYVLLLAVGMFLLVKGADWFVDGASNIAKALKIPSLIIGLTLVSMGTSAPEASVSINSALSGLSDMSIGNVVGSNMFNTLLILGLSAVIVPVAIDSDMKKYDIPIMIGTYVLLILFAYVFSPLTIELWEGLLLLLTLIAYMVFLIVRAKKSNANSGEAVSDGEIAKEAEKTQPIWKSIILSIVGLAGIIFGGDLVVDNASLIAIELGMSEVLVGLTIVAVGTSLPELVTSIVAAVKKENDIALGNVIGSNIFNIIFILGLSSSIAPLLLDQATLVDTLAMLVSGIAVLVIALCGKNMKKWQGVVMILAYVAYLAFIIIRG